MTDNELLLAISNMMDEKLKPMENRIKRIEVDLLEDKVLPRLNTIEACYTSTFDRYKDNVEGYEAIKNELSLIKKVIAEHGQMLQNIS